MGLGISKKEFRMMAVLLSGAFLAVLNATLMTPALPTIMGDMGVDSTTVQWLTSGYALTEAVVIPLAAYLMGRFSTRRLFIGGLTLFGCGSLVAALAPAFPALLAGRVMQAAATGFVMPMVFSVVLLLIPRERRGSAMGIVGLIIGMETIMPLYIQGVLGHTATVSGIAMLPGAVIGAFTGLLAGRLFDKHGMRHPVLAGAAGITVGLIGFASLQIDTPIVAVAVIYAVMAIGMQFTMTPVNTWSVNSLPNDAIQHAQSTSNTMNQVAASFGTALLVSVAATVSANTTSLTGLENTFFGYHAAFCITALLAGVAVVLIVALVRDGKRAKAGAGAAESRVVSVDVNTPLDVVCGVLAKRKIKKVPVTRDGVLVGALSRRNILHAIITGEQPGN